MAAAFILAAAATVSSAAAPGACLRALTSLAAGAVPSMNDFRAAPCSAREVPALRYDARIGAARTLRDIGEGETIAAPSAILPDVRPGDRLYLVARVGAATVEREVVAVQPGRSGRPVFVRTPDGRVLAARLRENSR
jgi:flagella basal body P-ring formation protein FlgA